MKSNILNNKININLNNIITNHNSKLEGCCLYEHMSNFIERKDNNILINNLNNIVKRKQNLLEIGFNGGHSNLIFLLSQNNLEITNFDICCNDYTKSCFKYLKTKFKNIELIIGDSKETIPKYIKENTNKKYDIIHIDGEHKIDSALIDIKNCKKLSNKETLLIIDDTHWKDLSNMLDNLIKDKVLIEYQYDNLIQKCKFHRIFYYLM